jgi:hypothetical protein
MADWTKIDPTTGEPMPGARQRAMAGVLGGDPYTQGLPDQQSLDTNWNLGLALSLTGDPGFSKVGGGLMSQAEAQRQRGHEMRIRSGERQEDREFRGQQAELARAQQLQLGQERLADARQRAGESNALRRTMMELQRGRGDLVQDEAGNYIRVGPDGQARPVMQNQQAPIDLGVSPAEAGSPTPTPQPQVGTFTDRVPVRGLPKARDPVGAKARQAVIDMSEGVDELDTILEQAKANPGAFGFRGSMVGASPNMVQGWVQSALLSPEEQQARAGIMRSAADIIKTLSGAAVSATEQRRLNQFLPSETDPMDVVLNKLEQARAEASRQRDFHAKAQGMTAPPSRRSNAAPPAAAAPVAAPQAAPVAAPGQPGQPVRMPLPPAAPQAAPAQVQEWDKRYDRR